MSEDTSKLTADPETPWALTYNDYALMLASVDAGWSRAHTSLGNSNENPFRNEISNALDELASSARYYRGSVCKNYKEWCAANGTSANEESISKGLFETSSWVPFGHADGLSMTLVDDLDAAQTIIEHYSKTVEEVTVAFCPKMEVYADSWTAGIHESMTEKIASGDQCEVRNPLVEPIDMFRPITETDRDTGVQIEYDRIDDRCPLLMFTRLRLAPLLVLGRILPFQQLVYHALARKMGSAWVELLRDKTATSGLFTDKDVQATRITFLDLQEEEEIGVLFWTPNLSVAASLMVAAQSLTINDLVSVSVGRVSTIFSSKFFKELGAWWAKSRNKAAKPQALEKVLGGNHVFRWSRSTAAFSWNMFNEAIDDEESKFDTDDPNKEGSPPPPDWMKFANGVVGIKTAVGISPGHQRAVDTFLGGSFNKLVADSDTDADTDTDADAEKEPEVAAGNFHFHTLGVQDRTIVWGKGGNVDECSPLKIGNFIQLCARFLVALKNEYAEDDPINRHITGWSSVVSLPIPKTGPHQPKRDGEESLEDYYHPPVDTEHHGAIILDLLGRIQAVRMELKNGEIKQDDPRNELAFLDPGTIRKATRKYGLPVTLRRSLMYLYEDFSSILTNVNSFDIVLDFLEVLATLHRTLTDELPGHLATEDSPDGYTPRANIEISEELAQILEALNHTFELRLRRVYPETPMRDWSLDFRSSLQQIVLGSQAVLKCALAVLRKDVLGLSDQNPEKDHERVMGTRDTLGVILRLRFGIGMQGHLLRELSGQSLATPQKSKDGPRLAVFEADFPLLSHIPGYVEVYHEAFHLIFEELRETGSPYQIKGGAHETEMLSEVFVHFLKFLFLFDGDQTLTLREHLIAYSSSASSGGFDVADLRERFIKNFFAACLPLLVAEKAELDADAGDEGTTFDAIVLTRVVLEPLELWSLRETCHFMWEKLWDVRNCFPDFDWLFPAAEKDRPDEFFVEGISEAYISCIESLVDSWRAARMIYSAHVRRLCNEFICNPNQADNADGFALGSDSEPLIPPDFASRYRKMVKDVDLSIEAAWAKEDGAAGFRPVVGIDLANANLAGECIDANLLIRRTLFRYLKIVRFPEPDGVRCRLSLTRKKSKNDSEPSSTGKIEFTTPAKGEPNHRVPYAKLLIDRTAVYPFCCDPAERRRMLGRQIGVLKTVWDIASRNRARRLRSLLRIICKIDNADESDQEASSN